jgi:hypothetical protein
MMKNLIKLTTLSSTLLLPFYVQAALVTYTIDGKFTSSDWNNDSTNALGPGGAISGLFVIDTSNQTVSQIDISTEFRSFYNNAQVMGATYSYGVDGVADQPIGFPPQSILIDAPVWGTRVGVVTDLTGSTNLGGAFGSTINILSAVPANTFGQRAFRPRLRILMEGVDFQDGAPDILNFQVIEEVWNVNIGTGRAGYSGTQNVTNFSAISSAVPEPSSALLALISCGILLRRTR